MLARRKTSSFPVCLSTGTTITISQDFIFPPYQYSSDSMIVVAERSASVMIRTRVLPLS